MGSPRGFIRPLDLLTPREHIWFLYHNGFPMVLETIRLGRTDSLRVHLEWQRPITQAVATVGNDVARTNPAVGFVPPWPGIWPPPNIPPTSYGVQFPDSMIAPPVRPALTPAPASLQAAVPTAAIAPNVSQPHPFSQAMESTRLSQLDPVVQSALHGHWTQLSTNMRNLQELVSGQARALERLMPATSGDSRCGVAPLTPTLPSATMNQTSKEKGIPAVPTFNGLGGNVRDWNNWEDEAKGKSASKRCISKFDWDS